MGLPLQSGKFELTKELLFSGSRNRLTSNDRLEGLSYPSHIDLLTLIEIKELGDVRANVNQSDWVSKQSKVQVHSHCSSVRDCDRAHHHQKDQGKNSVGGQDIIDAGMGTMNMRVGSVAMRSGVLHPPRVPKAQPVKIRFELQR